MVAQEIMCTNNVVIIWQCETKYAFEKQSVVYYIMCSLPRIKLTNPQPEGLLRHIILYIAAF